MAGPSRPGDARPGDPLERDTPLVRARNVDPSASTTLLEREILAALDRPLRPTELLRRFRATTAETSRTLDHLYRLGYVMPAGRVLAPLGLAGASSGTHWTGPMRPLSERVQRVAVPIGPAAEPAAVFADPAPSAAMRAPTAKTAARPRRNDPVELGRALPLVPACAPADAVPPPLPAAARVLAQRPLDAAPGDQRPAEAPRPAATVPPRPSPPHGLRPWQVAAGLASAAAVAAAIARTLLESLRGG